MTADPVVDDARAVRDWIVRTNQTVFSRRDAFSGLSRSRFRRVVDLDPALTLLNRHGFIRPTPALRADRWAARVTGLGGSSAGRRSRRGRTRWSKMTFCDFRGFRGTNGDLAASQHPSLFLGSNSPNDASPGVFPHVLWVGGGRLTAMATVLEREMYTEAAAARLLRVAPATLHYWLEGRSQGTRTYRPVIREEPTGSNRVTWAEFVEAGLLRQYRRTHRVPMIELRQFIDSLRQQLGVRYPLAHARPFVSGLKLVVQAQTDAGLDAEFALVAQVGGQYILTPAAQEFYERVTWEGDIAARWRPDANAESPVVIDPDVRFGAPSVGGISTSILREQDLAGEDEGDLAATFGLTLTQVRWALAYEMANEAA